MIVHSTDFKTNLGKYLDLVGNEDVYILRNNKPVAKMTSYSYFRDSDLLKENADTYEYKQIYMSYEEFIQRYEATDERMEYIDGVVYAMGSPSVKHQRILQEISVLFYNYFKGKKCQSYFAPLDVYFENSKDKACVQPDLLVICDPERICEGKYYGVPTLVVEITSPSTRVKDTITKLNLYWKEGVREYLLIDPNKEELFYWFFEDGDIYDHGILKKGETYVSRAFEKLGFDLVELFDRG